MTVPSTLPPEPRPKAPTEAKRASPAGATTGPEPRPPSKASLRDLFALNPGPWRWHIGVEVLLSTLISMGGWTLAGKPSHGLVGSLGIFLALYGVAWPRADRAVVLPFLGAGIVLSSMLGVLSSSHPATIVACLVVVTAVASTLSLGLALGPPGPLPFVLAAGVSARLADVVRTTGAMSPSDVPKLIGLGCAVTWLIVTLPLVSAKVRADPTPRAGLGILFRPLRFDAESRVIGARVVAAALVSGLVGWALDVTRVYWIVSASIAILQKSYAWNITHIRALQRLSGTIVGVALFVGLHHLEPSELWVVVIIALLQSSAEVVVTQNYALALIFLTPTALLISTAGHARGWQPLAEARFADTFLGAAVAFVVFWLGEGARIVERRAKDV